MRFQSFSALVLSGFISSAAWAASNSSITPPAPQTINPKTSSSSSNDSLDQEKPVTSHPAPPINQMNVLKLDGTIMITHADNTPPTALQTGSIVEKGDVITVYDGSWVIFKTHRGDQIGLEENTVVTMDECLMEGPDRQIRLLIKKGTLLLRTNSDTSRQSFFEIYMGNVVASIDNLQAIMSYDPSQDSVDIKYMNGKIDVIDQDHEENFTIEQGAYNGYTKSQSDEDENPGIPEEHTEHTWKNGKMLQQVPIPLDQIDEINFRRFFDGEKQLVPEDNNLLLNDEMQVPYRQR